MSLKSSSLCRALALLFAVILTLSLAACSSPEERAQAHYQSGMELMKAGEFAKAGLEFRNALKYNEKFAAAWIGLATTEEQKQNWPVVADALQRAVDLNANNVEAIIKLAKLQFAALQLDLALKNANQANQLRQDDPNILALRAAILFRLNDRDGARADAERALSIDPDHSDAHAVLAADQMANGNSTAALRFLDRGLVKEPNNLGLLLFKLKIFEDTKDDPRLEALLRQIIAAYPALKEMRQALLVFLSSRNRLADVEIEMRALVAADPTDTARALDLARFVGSVKGSDEARKELDKLVAANPGVADYKFALAQLDFSQKKVKPATSAIEAIIAKGEPKDDVRRAQLILASMSIHLGQAEKAKALIAAVLTEDEKNADALALRANLSLEAGEIDSAVADLREALNQQPNSVPLLMLLGRAHERQGGVDLANDRMAQALKASNFNPQVTLDYMAFLQRRGKNDQVESILSEAVARNPKDPRLLKALAQIRLDKQDWVGAQAAAESLKKIGDASGVTEQIIGAALFGQKKYDESIEALHGALSTNPQSAQPMYTLFLAYVQSGKIAEAENFLRSVLAANVDNAEAYVLLGSIKMLRKFPKEAEIDYKQAIAVQPNSPVGYVALSKHYMQQHQFAEAEAILKTGRGKAGTDLSLNLVLADLLQLKNDTEGAIAVYEEQLKTTPDALIVINNLASLLTDFRSDTASLDRAHQLAQRLESIDVPQFKDTVGWVAYRRGDYRGALLNLEQAADKLPDLALVKYHLATTYAALKRDADAKDQFTKADALLKDNDPLKEKIRLALTALNGGN